MGVSTALGGESFFAGWGLDLGLDLGGGVASGSGSGEMSSSVSGDGSRAGALPFPFFVGDFAGGASSISSSSATSVSG